MEILIRDMSFKFIVEDREESLFDQCISEANRGNTQVVSESFDSGSKVFGVREQRDIEILVAFLKQTVGTNLGIESVVPQQGEQIVSMNLVNSPQLYYKVTIF